MNDHEELKARVESLGQRIEAKQHELDTQGLLHGREREEMAEMKMRRAHLRNRLDEAGGIDQLLAREIATDVEILSHTFEHLIARVDRSSERK